MSCRASEAVAQMGKLVVNIAENGHSYKPECDENTLVEAVQKYLESACGIPFNHQLLLCLDLKLEAQRPLSAYKLPSDEREVFLFNKGRMQCNSPNPVPELVEIIDIPDPPLPSSSHNPHPLDEASDPALKALPSYERQFMYHLHCGHAIHSRTSAKFETCEKLLQEQKVQERALEIARGNLDHFYKMIHQNYTDFMRCYSKQHRSHANLLATFGRDKEKLRSIEILPSLQTAHHKCLLDFVKEENLQKTWEDCSSSHKQFEHKVSEFKLEFGDLKSNAEHLFSCEASFLIKDVESSIKDHRRFINEQKSIMQALSKDVDTVKKLVEDCLSCEMLRPHDAVSALGPMYDSHEKSHLPNMQACDHAISSLLDKCRDKKNEMNIFMHNFMQKIAYIQYTIKDMRYKFSVFVEALRRQDDQFEQLKVVRGIFPAYRACLAEVVRRKAAMKIYMGKAGQLAEKLATERDAEVKKREEFLKVHSTYIPEDILASMGMYDTPNPCDVNVTPFDSNLPDIDLSDLECYAPESLLGLSSKSGKHGTLGSSLFMSHDGSQVAEVEGIVDFPQKYDFQKLLEGSELVEIAGTSKMEVENAKLKAELASKIALVCSTSVDSDYESLDDSKLDSILKNAAEKTSEALYLKDVYEKHLQSLLKAKQMQCESYEKRIQELEQTLSDQYMQGCKLSGDDSSRKTDNNKSEVSGGGEVHMQHAVEEVSCASSSLKSEILPEHDKPQGGLDDNMTDSSSMLNPQLDSSMLDVHRDRGHVSDKDKKTTSLPDGGMAVAASDNVLELQNALAEKSSQLDKAETKIQTFIDEVSSLGRELEINRKLLDESQMNCAQLENCLHEAREKAQTHLYAADRRASEYSALRRSAVKMCGLFKRLRSCVSSAGLAAIDDSLRALAQSLASEGNDDSTAEFCECILVLADKVGILSRQRADLLERSLKLEAAKELLNTRYANHQLEKQAYKEKICFGRLEVHDIAAFVLNSSGHYEAINRSCPYYYLSAESVALFANNLHSRPSYIVGQVVHIERRIVKSSPSTPGHAESRGNQVDTLTSETGTSRLSLNAESTSNPYNLPVGCEYFVVTVAMLADSGVNSPPS